MEIAKFRALAQSALSQREQKSPSDGKVCGCVCRSNSTMDYGSANL